MLRNYNYLWRNEYSWNNKTANRLEFSSSNSY
nr:MAG TPA: hypothetical protein [Bacteriophage sp.]